jgi:predicted ribonuclease toxin of YeeF-YezG toxin-antitoxin module
MAKNSPEVNEALENDNLEQQEAGTKRAEHFESTYSLKPNEQYDSNEYHYETDSRGRIKRAEGTLRLEDGKRNTDHQTRAGGEYRLETDEGGHLIGRQFGGSEKIDNIVAMDYDVNHKEFGKLEKEWSDELKNGNQVDVQISCRYKGESERPESFIVKYQVTEPDGTTRNEIRRIKNGEGGGN